MNNLKKIEKDYTNSKTSNKKLDEKNRHHISWKNHGIADYIRDAEIEYLKKQQKTRSELK
jgi:hypothetical protein